MPGDPVMGMALRVGAESRMACNHSVMLRFIGGYDLSAWSCGSYPTVFSAASYRPRRAWGGRVVFEDRVRGAPFLLDPE